MFTKWKEKLYKLPNTISNFLITTFFLLLATIVSAVFFYFSPLHPYFTIPEQSAYINSINIALIYVLAIVLISRYTIGYLSGLFASLIGVCCVNFLCTTPYYHFSLSGYPLTFLSMLAISLLTSTATTHMKQQAIELSKHQKLLMEAEKEKMRANLLRAVSHDLRTPLTGMIGASATLLENKAKLTDIEKQNLVQHIYDDSNWLLNMVENLLSVTRIHNHNMKCVKKSMELVEEVVSEAVIRTKKRHPNASIVVSVPRDMIMIPMDAILIEQVIINLLENAIVHSQCTEPILFNVSTDNNFVCFIVRDYGVGISNERLKTIFDDFLPASSESVDGRKGMGIGLSICKTIIHAHNGTIFARNHSTGAEFCFTLPKEDTTYAAKNNNFTY